MKPTVAAVDLGAESGRVTAVEFDGRRLSVQVISRFQNTPRVRDGLLRWDIDNLWQHITTGLLELAAGGTSIGSTPIASVGVDTWGVDYGLLDAAGRLIDAPVSYRDGRNSACFTEALQTVGPRRLYSASGVQLLPINTIFALMADARDRPDRLAAAGTLLMMPDVFHHKLSGARVSEYTAVSTSGAYDMAAGRWATELLAELGVPVHMLPEVVAPGTEVGPLTGPLATGSLAGARVILPPAHDTASAVVGVPDPRPGGLFVSSGTWSLAGVEVDRPVITAASRDANLTNEGGYASTIRLLRNVMGLWILQECRRQWQREGISLSYPDLVELATLEQPLASVINPDAGEFLAPGDMPRRIRDYCVRHRIAVPTTVGAVARCIFDSLALSYRAVVDDLERVTGTRPHAVDIVGGGSNNGLLSQLTADATGLPVHCGPVEATALGNGAVQLATLGEFGGLAEIRQVIANSTEIVRYDPNGGDEWAAALAELRALQFRDLNPPQLGRALRSRSTG